jgi:hypothetical protein
MKNKSAVSVVFLFLVAMVISVCVMPAFAKINYEADSTYDYDGSSDHVGEEIQAKVTINPGENEVKDMRIDIFEADALIDDNSFDKTISPAWANVSLTQEGHTFFCDELKKGESVTLMFNAYPKTMKEEEEIKVVDVRISYTQLGQRLDDLEEIKVKLENSTWFEYEKAERRIESLEGEISTIKGLFNAAIIFIILGIAAIAFASFTWWTGRRRKGEEGEEMQKDFYEKLENISMRLDSAEVNPSEINSLKMSVKSYMEEYKPKEGGEE